MLITSINSKIRDIGSQIKLLSTEKLELALESIIIAINQSVDALDEFNREFSSLLEKQEINKEDELYKLLNQLNEDLKKSATKPNLNNAIKEVVDKSTKPILEQITLQKANKDITDYIKEELIAIFGLEAYFKNEIAENENNNTSGSQTIIPELPTNGTGGYDTGEFVVASDDVCFDPEKGIVKYGEVIDLYNGSISGLFKDGKLPKEYEEYFKNYYGILYEPKTDEEN